MESEQITEQITEQTPVDDRPRLPYLPAADALKFWLMPFVCFLCFGFPSRYGGNIAALSGFAPLCFYILCGFFTLTGESDERHRLKKGIRRSGKTFAILFAVCLAVNALMYILRGVSPLALFKALTTRRQLFNFFVLSAWPFAMGESIWFIQSLLYAYLFLWLLDVLHLRRLRWVLLALCTALMLASGELAVLVRFHFLGAPYLPPNVFTRALPYLLLGALLRRNRERLRAVKAWVYLLMVPAGLALAYGEFELLARYNLLITTSHAVGLGLAAFGLCAWVLLFLDIDAPGFFCIAGRPAARGVYLLSQPVAFLMIVPLASLAPGLAMYVQALGGIAVYPVCLALALLFDTIIANDKQINRMGRQASEAQI